MNEGVDFKTAIQLFEMREESEDKYNKFMEFLEKEHMPATFRIISRMARQIQDMYGEVNEPRV